MRYLLTGLFLTLFISGCATWSGIKEDSSNAAKWTKQKIDKGVNYIKEKTQ